MPFLKRPDTSSHGFTLGLCDSLHAKRRLSSKAIAIGYSQPDGFGPASCPTLRFAPTGCGHFESTRALFRHGIPEQSFALRRVSARALAEPARWCTGPEGHPAAFLGDAP